MKRFGGCRTLCVSPATTELGFVRGRSVGSEVSISVYERFARITQELPLNCVGRVLQTCSLFLFIYFF